MFRDWPFFRRGGSTGSTIRCTVVVGTREWGRRAAALRAMSQGRDKGSTGHEQHRCLHGALRTGCDCGHADGNADHERRGGRRRLGHDRGSTGDDADRHRGDAREHPRGGGTDPGAARTAVGDGRRRGVAGRPAGARHVEGRAAADPARARARVAPPRPSRPPRPGRPAAADHPTHAHDAPLTRSRRRPDS